MAVDISRVLQHILKFLIGFFGGICATIVPRMVTALATSDPKGRIDLFGTDYLELVIILSVFLGVGVMLLKWKEELDPPAMFTAALGLPAVFAGAFNVSANVADLANKQDEITRLNSVLLERGNVTEFPVQQELQFLSETDHSATDGPLFRFSAIFVSEARAEDSVVSPSPGDRFTPGQVLKEQSYFVIIGRTESPEAAKSLAEQHRGAAPNAAAVQGSNGYFVLETTQPRSLSDATLKALELKTKLPESNIGIMRVPTPTR